MHNGTQEPAAQRTLDNGTPYGELTRFCDEFGFQVVAILNEAPGTATLHCARMTSRIQGWGVKVTATVSPDKTSVLFSAVPTVRVSAHAGWTTPRLILPVDPPIRDIVCDNPFGYNVTYHWAALPAPETTARPAACDSRFLAAIELAFYNLVQTSEAAKKAMQPLIEHFGASEEGLFCGTAHSGVIHYDPIEESVEVAVHLRTADVSKIDRILSILKTNK